MNTIDKKVIDEKTRTELIREGFKNFVRDGYDLMIGTIIHQKFFWSSKREEVVIYEFNPKTGKYQLS